MAEDTTPRPSGGSFIQKKAGPFPLWGWAVIVGTAFGIVIILRRRTGGQPSAVGSMSAYPGSSGVLQSSPSTLADLTQAITDLNATIKQGPPSGPPGTGPIPDILGLQKQIGNGFGVLNGSNIIDTIDGSYAQVDQPYAALLAAGQGANIFYQAAPGVFLPVTYDVARTGAANGAPLFLFLKRTSLPPHSMQPAGSGLATNQISTAPG